MSKSLYRPQTHPDLPADDEIFSYIQELTAFGPRRSGSEAGILAADYIAGKFREFGLSDVAIEQGDTWQWEALRWSLQVEGIELPAFYMRHSFHAGTEGTFGTGAEGLYAELAYVGDRTNFADIDVAGKIVIADIRLAELPVGSLLQSASFHHDPDGTIAHDKTQLDPFTPNNFPFNFAAAIAGGAVGFIGILSNYFDSNKFYNEDIGYFVDDEFKLSLPGLWVSNKDGVTLKQLVARHGRAHARLTLEGAVRKVQYRTVVGHLPGCSAETLMVQSHHDSGFMGAVEDASGVAEVLALAKYYGMQPAGARARSLMFVSMDTHFTGYEAHEDFAHHYIGQGGIDVVANVTVEHIAREMAIADGQQVMTGQVETRVLIVSPSLLDLAAQLISQHDYRRTMVLPTTRFTHKTGLPTDVGPIQKIVGMPVVSLLSVPTYLYDACDTLDKVAFDQLQPTARLLADMLDVLDAMPREQIGRDH